jgi:hypothetical protein
MAILLLRHLVLTPHKLTKLPRGASGVIRKQLEKEAIGTLEPGEEARLNDFGRFQVMLAKKQRDAVRKAVHKSTAGDQGTYVGVENETSLSLPYVSLYGVSLQLVIIYAMRFAS